MAGLDFLGNIREGLRLGLLEALARAVREGDLPSWGDGPPGGDAPPFAIEAPRDRGHGDFAANLALVLAGRLKLPPRRIAEALAARFPVVPEGGADTPVPEAREVPVARLEVAGPGFLNFFMAPGWLDPLVPEILRAGAAYGRSDGGRGRRVQVEFVSANPTGPLNVVNARAGAFGDALAACLEAAGYEVRREFYVNDAGNQFALLGLAMEVRCRELLGQKAELPEGAYPGEYVVDLAREFLAGPRGEAARAVLGAPAAGGRAEAAPALAALREDLARFAVERIVAGQRRSLERYGVTYDRWARESEVRAAGGPERVLERLGRAGHLYERDGAVWFRSSAFGDDQDRVMVRRNGEHTYFLVDVAYHLDKFERGFDRVIDIWGQDHHGYVPRVRAALQALGVDASRLEVLLNQIVRLVRGGQPVRMSKRRGEFVTMDAFLDDVGRDAARFLFLMRSIDSHMDFDLDLARLQAAENPVYYVQYAHARVCSILRQAAAQGAAAPAAGPAALGRASLREEAEVALLRKLAEFPGEVAAAAEAREPHRLTAYARDLATLFHAFYAQCRVLSEDPALTAARLALADAFRRVLANALALLGVSAPERM